MLAGHVHFVYDVFDNLIGEEDDDTGSGSYDQEQWYVNEGGQAALVFNGDGALVERNLVAPNPSHVDAVVAQEAVTSPDSAGAVIWMADDKLGTPRDDVDNSGMLVNHEVFSAFGQIEYESNPAVISWAGFGGGHFAEETGLTQDGRRWYDAATGTWLSEDPRGFKNQNRDANLTRYAGNDPVDRIDPTGLSWLDMYASWMQSWVPWNYGTVGDAIYNNLPGSGQDALASTGDGALLAGTALFSTAIVVGSVYAAPYLAAGLGGQTTFVLPTISFTEMTVSGGALAAGGGIVLGTAPVAVSNSVLAATTLVGVYMVTGNGHGEDIDPSDETVLKEELEGEDTWIDTWLDNGDPL